MKTCTLKNRKVSLISKVLIFIMWIFLSRIINNEVIVPSIKSTIISFIEIVKEPDFLNIIKYTLFRTLAGFLISLVFSLLIGILSSICKSVYSLMIPILKCLNGIPTIAIIVLALIWLNHEFVPIFIGFIMTFPILYETIINSILNVNQDIIQMAYLYKVNKFSILKNIYAPNIIHNLSAIFNSILGINLKMIIAGEVLAQPKYGIGSSLQLQRIYLNTSGVFAWIIIILIISEGFSYMGKGLKKSLGINKWK